MKKETALRSAERNYAREKGVTVEHAQKVFWHNKKVKKQYMDDVFGRAIERDKYLKEKQDGKSST